MRLPAGPGTPGKGAKIVPKAGDRALLPSCGGNAINLGDEVLSFLSFQDPASIDIPLLSLWSVLCASYTYVCTYVGTRHL